MCKTPLKIDKPVTIRFCGLKTPISWFWVVNQADEFTRIYHEAAPGGNTGDNAVSGLIKITSEIKSIKGDLEIPSKIQVLFKIYCL